MHASISSALGLYPGEPFGFPSQGSTVALRIERTFESVLDVETGAIARFRQRNRCGARAGARSTEEEQGSARPVTSLLQSVHDFLDECAVRGGGEVLPLAEQRLALQRRQIRHPDKIPFRHGAHIDELCRSLAGEPLPSLLRTEIARIAQGGRGFRLGRTPLTHQTLRGKYVMPRSAKA